MVNQALAKLMNAYPLTERDPGEFSKIKYGPMRFTIRWFTGEGLGNVSSMEVKGLMGLFTMEMLVINPIERDLPLLSFDYMTVFTKKTLLVELYDTFIGTGCDLNALMSIKQKLCHLPDHDLGKHWYDDMKLSPSFAKRAGKKHQSDFENAFLTFVDEYLECFKTAELCPDRDKKRAKSAEYVNGLLKNGGPSTNIFLKMLGPDRTRTLFTKIIFGTEV